MKHGKHRKPDWADITLHILFWILFLLTLLGILWNMPEEIWTLCWMTLLTVWGIWNYHDSTHRGEHRK